MHIAFALVSIYSLLPHAIESIDSIGNFYDRIRESSTVAVPDELGGAVAVTDAHSFKSSTNETKYWWVKDAIKDIAYFLRAHKFNEYDRRFQRNGLENVSKTYFAEFPKPPLRSLHWEVHKYCDSAFLSCIEYLHSKVKKAVMQRRDDTAVVMHQQGWSLQNNSGSIAIVNEECLKEHEEDERLADPFQGPMERFQWRTTASYYMCWYTMNGVMDLKHIHDRCDNFAACLDRDFGPENRDVRANDSEPFQCAMYSFCPDPCCPIRHLQRPEQCWNAKENPCGQGNEEGHKMCEMASEFNMDFKDIILNKWNVTCQCPRPGFRWDSRYGICVDVDECATGIHGCDEHKGQACLNLEGSYRCTCAEGQIWSVPKERCVRSQAFTTMLSTQSAEEDVTENDNGKSNSIVKRFFHKIIPLNSKERSNDLNITGSEDTVAASSASKRLTYEMVTVWSVFISVIGF